jgi:hypothetical protein
VKGQSAIEFSADLLNDVPRQRLAIASIGSTLKESLQVPRLVSLSIHDCDAELLWLSENLLGPDEHSVIVDAIDELRASTKLPHVQRDMGDGRQATLLAARTTDGRLGALVMAMSMALWKPARGARGLISADAIEPLQHVAELALLSKPQAPAPAVAPAAAPTLEPVSRHPAPRRSAVSAALAAGVHFHLAREPLTRLSAAAEPGLVRVRGRSARGDETDLAVSPASDRIVVAELIRLLDRESAGAAQIDRHVLRLSEQSIQDPGFLRYTAMRLQQAPKVAGLIGFAVEESLLIKHPVALGGFFEGCESLGCFVIVEGFTMHAESLPIIATRALRAISFQLPSDRRDGKPSPAARAYAVAMTFFCKAMKVDCIAQTGRPDANRRWLGRIGAAYVE